MMQAFATTLLALAALLIAARGAEVIDTSGVDCPVMGAHGADLEWDYDNFGEKGPAKWEAKYKECAGQYQSPIDFPLSVKFAPKANGPKPKLGSIQVTAAGTNNNFALACPVAGSCGYTMMDGVNYTVANGHFHSPAEHTLNGQRFPLELHIVHANPDATKFLVLAILFRYPESASYAAQVHDQAGRDWGVNALLKQTLSHVRGGAGAHAEFSVPLHSVVEDDGGFCAYGGSLTTPPCTEAVTFYMSMKVQTVSQAQVFAYSRAAGAGVHGNNRPVMPINGRDVTCYVR